MSDTGPQSLRLMSVTSGERPEYELAIFREETPVRGPNGDIRKNI